MLWRRELATRLSQHALPCQAAEVDVLFAAERLVLYRGGEAAAPRQLEYDIGGWQQRGCNTGARHCQPQPLPRPTLQSHDARMAAPQQSIYCLPAVLEESYWGVPRSALPLLLTAAGAVAVSGRSAALCAHS